MPSGRINFDRVLTEAIRDVGAHGFDSAERIAYWQKRLKEAAEASMASEAQVRDRLNAALVSIYRKLVDNGGALNRHPGVSRFTLEKIAPQLRAELHRRILMSADLIKLNRANAIQKTLQRFSGWASSIPAGGSKVVEKRKEKLNVKKSIHSLPFEERRVIIDQGHKLSSSINETIARGGQAIGGIWHSHWRQPGYNFREHHKERDQQVYLLKGSWALREGLIKPGDAGYLDDITKAGEEPFCRCFVEYIYHLRQLPPDMLTKRGAEELERVRRMVKASRTF